GGASPGFRAPSGCSAGKDSTLVGLSMPRQLQFSVRIPASSVSMTASSASPTSASTASAAAMIARWITASASGSCCQLSATTRTSVMGSVNCDIVVWGVSSGAPDGATTLVICLFARRLLRRAFIGGDNPCHQLMADHVFGGEPHLGDAVDAME